MTTGRLLLAIDRFKTWTKRPAISWMFRGIGLGILTFGVIWSLAGLDLSWHEVSPGFLALNLLLLTPANLALASIALRINGWALDRDIPQARSVQTAAFANVAELLPLPAGAAARMAALIEAGASITESGRIIILTSVMTLLMTMTLSLTALAVLADSFWIWPALASTVGVAGTSVLLLRRSKMRHLIAMLSVRIVMLVLTTTRLSIAFATIANSISLVEAALYVIAPTLGATVAIIPAGLGVNEAIAAALATLIAGSATSAFLAVAMNRVLDLIVGGIAVFVLFLMKRPGPK